MTAKPDTTPTLACPACRARFPLPAIFDASDASWPNQNWIGFDCPECGRFSHVALRAGQVDIGTIDGAPGPCFVSNESAAAPGLTIESRARGISIRCGGRRWFVKAWE